MGIENQEFTGETFRAAALLNIYHFADLAYPGVREKGERDRLFRILREAGHLGGCRDAEDCAGPVNSLYCGWVEEYAASVLPEEWQPRYDYWGAKCFSDNHGWNDPKTGTILAGDGSSQYLFCSDLQALKEYLERRMGELEIAPRKP